MDELVWNQVVELLSNPEVVRSEIHRRIEEIKDINPTKQRKEVLEKEIVRIEKSIHKLLDAYQEDLLNLEELRDRMPQLRRRQNAFKAELRDIDSALTYQHAVLRLTNNIKTFLHKLRKAADTINVVERQKVLRLIVKEIQLDDESLTIKHSIPLTTPSKTEKPIKGSEITSYLLRSGRHHSALRCATTVALAASSVALRPLTILFHDRGLEPHPNQVQYAAVADSFGHQDHELGVGNHVEVLFQISVNDLRVSSTQGTCHVVDGIVGRLLGPEPVGCIAEVGFKDRLDDQFCRHLSHPVPDGRNPQRSEFSVALRNHHPFDRGRSVRLVLNCLGQFHQKGGYPFGSLDVLKGATIYASGTFVGLNKVVGMTEEICPIYLVIQGVETVGRFLLGLAVKLPL